MRKWEKALIKKNQINIEEVEKYYLINRITVEFEEYDEDDIERIGEHNFKRLGYLHERDLKDLERLKTRVKKGLEHQCIEVYSLYNDDGVIRVEDHYESIWESIPKGYKVR